MHGLTATHLLVALVLTTPARGHPGPLLPNESTNPSRTAPGWDFMPETLSANGSRSDSPLSGGIDDDVDVSDEPSASTRSWTPATSRPSCHDGVPSTVTGLNSTERILKVRQLMRDHGVDAYIVPSDDEHGSEYTSTPDYRRQWITGFTGSAGDVVLTQDSAALWTDSRYYIQADRQMDCHWTLMKKGETDVPTIEKWLAKHVEKNGKIGADPRLISYTQWSSWDNYLAGVQGPRMQVVDENLIDTAWGDERPSFPDQALEILDLKYTGMTWQEKVTKVRDSMRASGGDLLVLSALDDTAWLLNMRGDEVPFTPVFRCYVVIGLDTVHVFIPETKITEAVRNHLLDPDIKVELHPHGDIWTALPTLSASANQVLLTSPAAYHVGSSYKLYASVQPSKTKFIASPVLYLKAIKNHVEVDGMKRAHVKDAAALIQMLSTLAEEVPAGKYWDELQVVRELEKLRWNQSESRGPSFGTISAFGVNSALPHYEPTNDTNLQITTDGLFMLDSGGQYLDGTTDVTRTVHFGKPTPEQIEIYTKLLQGCIALASTKFPEGRTMQNLDLLIRAPLYSIGLQYGHGSTHGIGAYLAVHESFDYKYHANFFGSQEPGYYEEGKFGMRLENIVRVEPAQVKYKSATKFLTFETVTLVPYERKLIDSSVLSPDEMVWLNTYSQRIRIAVGPELLKQNKTKAYRWMMEQTQPFC